MTIVIVLGAAWSYLTLEFGVLPSLTIFQR